jgi:hypothetical protein
MASKMGMSAESFVEADNGDERRGLLVDAEHAAGVVDEGGRHFKLAGRKRRLLERFTGSQQLLWLPLAPAAEASARRQT